MNLMFKEERKLAQDWFLKLRDKLCAELESIEGIYLQDNLHDMQHVKRDDRSTFQRREWQRIEGGGGVSSIMRGNVFEKAGVNVSTVFGDFSDDVMREMKFEISEFWASGISVVIHSQSPLIPAAHMNTRFFVNGTQCWFGGVADITPAIRDADYEQQFHNALRQCCDDYDANAYAKFKAQCDEYFYIPHRKIGRGSGGIFYDHLCSDNWSKDFSLTQSIGSSFVNTYIAMVKEKMHLSWKKEEKDAQLKRRGLYVEFNLLYDRGTRFGLMTNGDVEAIFMSMPPEAAW